MGFGEVLPQDQSRLEEALENIRQPLVRLALFLLLASIAMGVLWVINLALARTTEPIDGGRFSRALAALTTVGLVYGLRVPGRVLARFTGQDKAEDWDLPTSIKDLLPQGLPWKVPIALLAVTMLCEYAALDSGQPLVMGEHIGIHLLGAAGLTQRDVQAVIAPIHDWLHAKVLPAHLGSATSATVLWLSVRGLLAAFGGGIVGVAIGFGLRIGV